MLGLEYLWLVTGSPDQARRILDFLGLKADQFVLAEPQGVANDTWLCGYWVVRISKDAEYLEDLFTESVAAPAAFLAGVRSAEPIHFQMESLGDIPPFSVYRRVAGSPLSRVGEMKDPHAFFRAYGVELRKVHGIKEVEDPHQYLDEAWELEPESLLEAAAGFGLRDEVSRLLEYVQFDQARFVHQDLHADNVLVDEMGMPVFLDWGDAGFGDPAADFRYLPAAFLQVVLEGYVDSAPDLVSRIKLHIFDQYVYCQKMERSYGRFGETDLVLLRALLNEC